MGELVLVDHFAKDAAVLCILKGCLISGLHDANCSSSGLDATVFETSHLKVEAFANSFFAANQVFVRDEPVVERDFVGVHASVANGVDRAAFHFAGAMRTVLAAGEAMTIATVFFDHEDRQATVTFRAIRIGASQQHEDASPRRKGAPGLGAIDDPSTFNF